MALPTTALAPVGCLALAFALATAVVALATAVVALATAVVALSTAVVALATAIIALATAVVALASSSSSVALVALATSGDFRTLSSDTLEDLEEETLLSLALLA